MVEAAVAIPFFIIILAGTVFIGGFYGQRIDAQAEAREQTWLKAVNENCDANPDGELEGLTVVDSADLGELSKSPLGALCDKDVGVAAYTAKRTYKVTGAINFSSNINAIATCPCNESPVAGDVAYESAVEYLWNIYQEDGVAPQPARFPSFFMKGLFGGFGGAYYY
jgi:hypothetical protein